MKSFVFRLESVLTLRIRDEERAREAVALAMKAHAEIALALNDARTQLDDCHAALTQCRCSATNRNEQILLLNAIQQQQSHCERLAARLAAAEREAHLRREELLIARRRREALAQLQEKQLRAHRAEEARIEQIEVTDLINARHTLSIEEAVA
jgi:flagellar export protein FliJ